jgi:Tfp pilus assembly protein PilV
VGFTLVESMIAATLLGAAVVGIMGPLCASHAQTQSMRDNAICLTLDRELLEEIVAKPYLSPTGTEPTGPGNLTSRAQYTAAGDYNTYSDTTTSLTSLAGASVTIVSGETYSRKVVVQYQTSRTGSSSTSGDYALVTVTATAPSGISVSLSRMVTRMKVEF